MEYILANAKEVLRMTIHELATKAEASSAAVVRFCRSLGIEGFPALKIRLSAEVSDPELQKINKKIINFLEMLKERISEEDFDQVEKLFDLQSDSSSI